MRGRPPKTEIELKTNGTYRPAYHKNRMKAQPISEIPPPPADFDAEHKATWIEFCQRLKEEDLLTNLDLDAVRTYVEAKVTAFNTYAVLRAKKFMLGDRKHPLHMVYAEAVKTMRAMYDQFGLTPRARMGLKKEAKKPEEQKDPLAEIIKMMNHAG